MSEQKHDYKTSSALSEFVAFIGWLAIVVAFITAFVLFKEAGSFGLIAIPICIAVGLVGLLLVVSGQSLRAQLDTANATKQLLKLKQES